MQQEAMEDDKNNPKYAKLLAEYSKLRTQAKVLKNAVVEERNKGSVLQESLRIKDQNLRRAESEIDSQNFRNKQLERRIESLQNDLQAFQQKLKGGGGKARDNQSVSGNGDFDSVMAEELQRRIIENAQLATTISDKNNEIEMYTNRIKDLEMQVSKQMHDHAESEKRLRKEIEVLMTKHTELETKIIEATSQMGSEGDSASLASDSTMPLHSLIATTSGNPHTDDRIAFLEKELNHYRTQYELLKINDTLRLDEHLLLSSQSQNSIQNNHNNQNQQQQQQQRKVLSSQSSTSTTSSMSNNNNNHSTFVNYPTSSQSSGSKSSPCQNSKSLPDASKCDDENSEPLNRDQVIYDLFSKRFEELFHEKCKAESKVINYVTECESLKNNIELLMLDLEEKEKVLRESQASYVRLEEDFLTTRVNYEDQICVLTDQVISLSDQLSSR